MPCPHVVALPVLLLGGVRAPADAAAGHAVHDQSVVDERGVGVVHRRVHVLHPRIGDRPRGSSVERDHLDQVAQQDLAVRARVRDPGVLDEAAVGVEAVAAEHVREDRRQRTRPEGGQCRVLGQHPAQRQDAAQVRPVGPGAGAGVARHRRCRDEVVDRGAIVGQLGGRQPAVHQKRRVEQSLRRTDLPVPPVVVRRRGGRIGVGVHPVQAGADLRGQRVVRGQARARLDVGQRHRAQPPVGAGQVGRHRADRKVRPQRRSRGGHRVAVARRLGAELGQGGGEWGDRRVESAAGQGVDPYPAHRVVGVGRPRVRGQHRRSHHGQQGRFPRQAEQSAAGHPVRRRAVVREHEFHRGVLLDNLGWSRGRGVASPLVVGVLRVRCGL